MYSEANNLTGTGYLTVRVTTASGAIPLEGAQVNIREYSPQNPMEGAFVASLISGADGTTELISLPTHPKAESLVAGSVAPYSTYVAEVRLEGYSDQTFVGIPIFDGIIAVQPVNMIPLPESGTAYPQYQENDQFFETRGNDL